MRAPRQNPPCLKNEAQIMTGGPGGTARLPRLSLPSCPAIRAIAAPPRLPSQSPPLKSTPATASALRPPDTDQTDPHHQGPAHGLGRRKFRFQLQPDHALQGHRAAQAHLVHPRRARHLPLRHLHPGPRRRSRRHGRNAQPPRRRHPGHVQHVHWRRPRPHDRLRPQHHALHQRQHHRAADVVGHSHAGSPQEGRRNRPQEDEPVHAIPHRADRPGPVLRHLPRPGRHARQCRRRRGRRTRLVLRGILRRHPGRRHHVPDVARRADHRPRHRQRHLAHHLLRHRRQPAQRPRQPAGTRPHRRPLAGVHRQLPGHRRGGHRLHRVHGARPAAHRHPVPPNARSAAACSAATAPTCR